jgi:hypothetical protein
LGAEPAMAASRAPPTTSTRKSFAIR